MYDFLATAVHVASGQMVSCSGGISRPRVWIRDEEGRMKTNAPIGCGTRMQTAFKGAGSAMRGAPVHADDSNPCAFKSRLFTILSRHARTGGASSELTLAEWNWLVALSLAEWKWSRTRHGLKPTDPHGYRVCFCSSSRAKEHRYDEGHLHRKFLLQRV